MIRGIIALLLFRRYAILSTYVNWNCSCRWSDRWVYSRTLFSCFCTLHNIIVTAKATIFYVDSLIILFRYYCFL